MKEIYFQIRKIKKPRMHLFILYTKREICELTIKDTKSN